MLCNKCGNNVPNGMKTCTHCGNRLSAPPKDPKFNAYLEKLSAKYFAQEYIKIGSFDVTDLKESPQGVEVKTSGVVALNPIRNKVLLEIIKNKFKFITYVTYSENVTLELMQEYYKTCLSYANKKYAQGCCYIIMVGKNIDDEVYSFKKIKPGIFNQIKSFSVIVDLKNNKVSYDFSKLNVGTAFYKGLVEYLESKFIVNFDDIKVE
ncbi:MAG: hypothetical protein A2Y17_05265 [Clostridiales bacterium GWF2_38_85]|nr:MAG: hypothetical protein A2Y17_05265 [Clostridiales bacterium GWF2_38_85]HBL83361.1 hypothetical protein [Clostridiales bacterium]